MFLDELNVECLMSSFDMLTKRTISSAMQVAGTFVVPGSTSLSCLLFIIPEINMNRRIENVIEHDVQAYYTKIANDGWDSFELWAKEV